MIEEALRRLPRRAALATLHHKERQLGPALAELGLELVVASVDTDAFGTFAGERPRALGPEATVLAKARAALDADPAAGWGVATEGSFGPHPDAPWVTVHEELAVLLARDGAEEVLARVTRVASAWQARAAGEDEAVALARRWGFPEHGVIVLADGGDAPAPARGVEKEAGDEDALRDAVRRLGPAVWLASDLRAHRHPPRHAALVEVAAQLVARARTPCPACGRAGFGPAGVEPGRPCATCGTPTDAARARREACRRCGCTRVVPIPGPDADPGRCPRCNP